PQSHCTSSRAVSSPYEHYARPLPTHLCFLLLLRRHHRSTLFPYTTLFRSRSSPKGSFPKSARSDPATWRHLACVYSSIGHHRTQDRKSTRLNSSHVKISYAVFCLKKKSDSTLRIRFACS